MSRLTSKFGYARSNKPQWKGKLGIYDFLPFLYTIPKNKSYPIFTVTLIVLTILSFGMYQLKRAVDSRVIVQEDTDYQINRAMIPLHAQIEVLKNKVAELEANAKIIYYRPRKIRKVEVMRRGKKTYQYRKM